MIDNHPKSSYRAKNLKNRAISELAEFCTVTNSSMRNSLKMVQISDNQPDVFIVCICLDFNSFIIYGMYRLPNSHEFDFY